MLDKINVLAELEKLKITAQSAGADEVLVRCPYHHPDNNPSCSINLVTRLFNCHACKVGGDIISFIARAAEQPRILVAEQLSREYGLTSGIPNLAIQTYEADLQKAAHLLKELYARGLTDEHIRKYRLGALNNRIAIPIYDAHGSCVNIRKYLPGAIRNKFQNLKGKGQNRLYPIEQLSFDKIIICGGEIKAIATAERLNASGYGAISTTAGEGSWADEFNQALAGKEVFVCFDIDGAGIEATNSLSARLMGVASICKYIRLPLSQKDYPTGDISNYWALGNKPSDFIELINSAPKWEPIGSVDGIDTPSEPLVIPLTQLTSNVAKLVQTDAVITAQVDTAYAVPKDVLCTCKRNAPYCFACPIFRKPVAESVIMCVPEDSPAILSMVGAAQHKMRPATLSALKMPNCKSVKFKPLSWYKVDEVRLTPSLDMNENNFTMLPAFIVNKGVSLNETYRLIGRSYPHPKNQQSVFLVKETEERQDTLSSFAPTLEELEELKVFQPAASSVVGIEAKLTELYLDLESNVTHIYLRRHLHLIVDLAYHSVLNINFDDKLIKGWLEVLVLGDSSQGKSETTTRLQEHYGLGERVECKNATVAGLLGGCIHSGTKWLISWGVIPTHDRRLVILEELKGASVEIISKLTDMRSSGIAEIPKIEKRRTNARTRLIALSNPRREAPLSDYTFGIEAIKELIGSLEDIRRFDFSLLVSSQQINVGELNAIISNKPLVEHKHRSDLCHRLVLWAWTRLPEQVIFEDIKIINNCAVRLCEQFSEELPLVDKGSMRYKLARLATALACRLFSCTPDMQSVIVRKEHVEYIYNLIVNIYGSNLFGYLDFTQAIKAHSELKDPEKIKARLCNTSHPKEFVTRLLNTSEFTLFDIRDWIGNQDEAAALCSYLVVKHAINKEVNARGYRKSGEFISLLKELSLSEQLANARPSHIEEF